MRSILVSIPHATDATSFYRSVPPLVDMKRKMDLNLVFAQMFDWSVMDMCDAFFMQRPFTAEHKMVATIAKDSRLPLWVDYDDDLFSVPSDNPAYGIYSNKDIQANVANIIAIADVVTVSTQKLKDKIAPLNRNIIVVPNAFAGSRIEINTVDYNLPKKKLVMWRGSQTHVRDVMSVGQQLIEVSNAHAEDCAWNFVGANHWFVTDRMPKDKVIVTQPMDPKKYFQYIQKTKPGIMIVPLHDSEFNRSKSNIAWIEGSYAGAASLCPDWDEWRRPGAITYTSAKDFGEKLDMMIKGEIDLVAQAKQSWQYIQDLLTLEKVNALRINALEGIL